MHLDGPWRKVSVYWTSSALTCGRTAPGQGGAGRACPQRALTNAGEVFDIISDPACCRKHLCWHSSGWWKMFSGSPVLMSRLADRYAIVFLVLTVGACRRRLVA